MTRRISKNKGEEKEYLLVYGEGTEEASVKASSREEAEKKLAQKLYKEWNKGRVTPPYSMSHIKKYLNQFENVIMSEDEYKRIWGDR